MTKVFIASILALSMTLSQGSATAAEYCTLPYLNATNIRTACEQYGSNGLHGLYSSNRFIQQLLNTQRTVATKVH